MGLNNVACQITASYEGVFVDDATVNATSPFGDEYPACTTIQYQLRPVSNATSFTVSPTATNVHGTNKTPEEMQADAEESEWLSMAATHTLFKVFY